MCLGDRDISIETYGGLGIFIEASMASLIGSGFNGNEAQGSDEG